MMKTLLADNYVSSKKRDAMKWQEKIEAIKNYYEI
jgi:hypothetical protein